MGKNSPPHTPRRALGLVRIIGAYRSFNTLARGFMRLILFIVLSTVFGCGTPRRLALGIQADIMEKAVDDLQMERDWEWFAEASPSNIQLIESFLYQEPTNTSLQRALVKALVGYGYLVHHTKALEETYASRPGAEVEQTLKFYAKAMRYGREYFKQHDISWKELTQSPESELREKLKKLDVEDHKLILYFAQAWALSIEMQKQDIALLAQLPRAKLLFDVVCEKSPEMEQGACPLFFAQYEAARPVIAGGNPVKAQKQFQEFIKTHPTHLLARILYVQYSVIPRMEEEEFAQEMKIFEAGQSSWKEAQMPSALDVSNHKDYLLLNATAFKRWEIISRMRSKLF